MPKQVLKCSECGCTNFTYYGLTDTYECEECDKVIEAEDVSSYLEEVKANEMHTAM